METPSRPHMVMPRTPIFLTIAVTKNADSIDETTTLSPAGISY